MTTGSQTVLPERRPQHVTRRPGVCTGGEDRDVAAGDWRGTRRTWTKCKRCVKAKLNCVWVVHIVRADVRVVSGI